MLFKKIKIKIAKTHPKPRDIYLDFNLSFFPFIYVKYGFDVI